MNFDTQLKLAKIKSDILWKLEHPSKSKLLYDELEIEVGLLEWFRDIMNYTNKQLLECLDKYDRWFWFKDEYTNLAFAWGHKAEEEDILHDFNPSLTKEDIAAIIEAYEIRQNNTSREEHRRINKIHDIQIKQTTSVIHYLIRKYKTPSEKAFKLWYHSKTKEFIDTNNIYTLTGKQCAKILIAELKSRREK